MASLDGVSGTATLTAIATAKVIKVNPGSRATSRQLLAGGKTGKLYLLNTANLGKEQANDAGATQTFYFDSGLSSPYSQSCTDSAGTFTAQINSYESFGTAAYFNGSVYLGVTPTSLAVAAGVRQFAVSGNNAVTPGTETTPSVQENTRGTTPSTGEIDVYGLK